MLGRQIEIIHRPRDRKVRIGVEPGDERAALVPQIALNLEHVAEQRRAARCTTLPPAKLAGQRLLAQIRDVRRHPRDGEAPRRNSPRPPVRPAVPVRIGKNRLPTHLMERDILRRMKRSRRHGHACEHVGRIGRGPFQRLHAAHRSAHDRKQPPHAEIRHQQPLRPHHVPHGDRRKLRPVPLARRAIATWPGAAHAAAQHVRAHDEEPAGVDRAPRPHNQVPPAGPSRQGLRLGHILIARQRMADQDGIAGTGVEHAVGSVCDGDAGQHLPAIERKGLWKRDSLMRDSLVRDGRVVLIHGRVVHRPRGCARQAD